MNSCVKARQIVGAGDGNVLYTPVFQVVEHDRPELGALIFANPHTQNIFPAVQIDTNGNVDWLSSRSALRCEHGSGWRPERPPCRWVPETATAILW